NQSDIALPAVRTHRPSPMHYRYFLPALAVLSFGPAASAVEPSDLKPGLVATYADVRNGPSPGVTRLEPTVALTLAKGETPHPSLETGGVAVWKGYINITRPGKYTFSATVGAGQLAVRISDKGVLTARNDAPEPKTMTGAEVTLEGGVQHFEAEFRRVLGP